MSDSADYLFALELQKQFNSEQSKDDEDIELIDFKPPSSRPLKKPLQIKRSNPRSNLDEEFLNRTQNLVHPLWETLDPTPDVQSLFTAFDGKFFQQRLKCVTLEWSKRMYSCAGICYSNRNRYGMSITIRLSEPLLKLRPRKDLVETMLHEMIHAYCFVLKIREGNGGHGPNFKKIMYSINQVAGTNITVYHTFHDEVDLYKQHWWRCNGACQNRSPFFGYVKRTSNRAPSVNDQWWAAHQESCGGTFLKIKGPEPKKPNSSRAKENTPKTAGAEDLRNFFPNVKKDGRSAGATTTGGITKPNGGGFKGAIKSNGGGTMLLNPKTKPSSASTISSAFPPSSYPGLSTDPFNSGTAATTSKPIVPGGGNLRNVVGFRDLNSTGGGTPGRAIINSKPIQAAMVGPGYALSSNSSVHATSTNHQSGGENRADPNLLRKIWSKRFDDGKSSHENDSVTRGLGDVGIQPQRQEATGDIKRRRLSSNASVDDSDDVLFVADEIKKTNNKKNSWIKFDDDVLLKENTNEIIALSSDDEDGDDEHTNTYTPSEPRFKQQKMTADERQTVIKQEILDETCDLRDEDIILIDDEYDDAEDDLNLSAASELADTSLIDEFFSDDTLLQDFKRENDVVPSGSRYVHNPLDDIITCPICQYKMKRSVLAEHLDGCTGIVVKIMPHMPAMKKLASISREVKPKRATTFRKTKNDILREAGYSERDLQNLYLSSSTDDEESFRSSALTSTPGSSPQANSELNDNWQLYRQRNLLKTTRQCPACAKDIEEDDINEHLDYCLKKRRKNAA